MADKLGLGPEVRQLKIGQSFTNPKSSAFHTIRYDFKPASVDTCKMASIDVGGNHQVTVTVPHLDGAGIPQTVFKGSQKPYQKSCVLVIDRNTGSITLENLSGNIQVKKTRSEQYAKAAARPQTPVEHSVPQRLSSKTKVTTSGRKKAPAPPSAPPSSSASSASLVPRHSPLHASPSYHNKSPKTAELSHQSSAGAAGSLPMIIGLDDHQESEDEPAAHNNGSGAAGVGVLSESSSSSSSESASSDSDSEHQVNGGLVHHSPKASNRLLNEDLCLSESGSESD